MGNLSQEDNQRYHELFKKLDLNSDGKIDMNDLVKVFEKHKNSKETSITRAQKLMSKVNKVDDLNFTEFVQYMIDHEKKLELVFKGIDTDNDDKINFQELIKYFKKLNVEISEQEAQKLVGKINRNGSLTIEQNVWKEFFFLAPIDNLDELLYHWRYSTLIDTGEYNVLPEDLVDPSHSRWYRNLIAGAIAGAVSRTSTAPFDRLKTVMQVLGSRKQIKIIGGFQHMLNEGGFLSLWRGNGMNVLKIALEGALKFAFYEELKVVFTGKNKTREPTILERFLAGALAGGMAQSIIYPLEVLKTRMVLRKTGEYSSIYDCANKIIKNEGVRAFYKGYIPNILGIIPYAGTDLAAYETLKRFYMVRYQTVDNPPIPVLLMCGTVSTLCGQLISYPLSLVRTRLQAQEVPMDSSKRDTMSKLLVRIWRNEGIRGLYRGILPNMIKVVPAVSISYAVYENIKKKA